MNTDHPWVLVWASGHIINVSAIEGTERAHVLQLYTSLSVSLGNFSSSG